MSLSDDIIKKIQEEINRRGGMVHSTNENNQIVREVTDMHNTSLLPGFEGLSPSQMHYILNDPFSEECVVRFNKNMNPAYTSQLPMVQIGIIILNNIDPVKGLNLTMTGKLSRKIIREIYNLGFFGQNQDIILTSKVLNEADYLPAGMGHILLKLAGLIRIRKNRMYLTNSGRSAQQNSNELFTKLFQSFVQKFNKGYFDRYENEEIGNTVFAFIIYLLARYGDVLRDCDFYARKYFKAFPMLASLSSSQYINSEYNPNHSCFKIRVITRGLDLFGLVDLKVTKLDFYRFKYSVKKSPAFDSIFSITIR